MRQGSTGANPASGTTNATGTAPAVSPAPIGYFDQTGQPIIGKERSTVGSASATGSAGGRTTWASGSDLYEDKMSEDDGVSLAAFSDEGNASLVGFGEAANTPGLVPASRTPQGLGRAPGSPMQGIEKDKMLNGQTYDESVVDTTTRNPIPIGNLERKD